jgi:hypothetical protein
MMLSIKPGLREVFAFTEDLHRRFAIAVLPAMWPLIVIHKQPLIDILLQFFYRVVDFLSECNAVELVLHRPMEAFTEDYLLI